MIATVVIFTALHNYSTILFISIRLYVRSLWLFATCYKLVLLKAIHLILTSNLNPW